MNVLEPRNLCIFWCNDHLYVKSVTVDMMEMPSRDNGSKNTKIFTNVYGKWTVTILSVGYYPSLIGIIFLDPVFKKKLVDWKQVNIEVDCKNSNGYNESVTAENLEKTTFVFQTSSNQGSYCTLSYQINIKIKMPEISIIEDKRFGTKNHLKSLFDSGKDSDITIKAEEKEIKVHKLILKRSEVFAKMLNGTSKETQSKIIEIKDIKYEVIVEMCRFLYYDEIPKIDSLALPLLIAADKYMINDLANKCEKFLMLNITIGNFHEVLVTADQLNKNKLREATIDYIIANRKSIFPSVTWKTLKTNHMQLAMLVMEKFMLKDA
ncbi:hypothetical protein PVAND_000939 [Polypedilum vanderplanki]|uniref:BTB domain-containing protein n=1 Tax=Polypedilum vanderplanki TaxID=319348 RepID=A0A9J6BLF4_POLVA|nr:hypothetical protein PVAND_000939 [Polypedilum vanderplanki]